MKDLLSDVVRQTAPHFDRIRIIGADSGTRVEAYTEDKMLFLEADLTDVVPDFAGEFGLSNLTLLKSVLDFPSYKADNSSFQVSRLERDGFNYAAELVFGDSVGGRTKFKTINPRMISDRATIAPINWTVSIMPSKAKLTEVIQLTGMLAQVEQHFAVVYENHTVFLTIGSKSAASHNASVALATDIDCKALPKSVFKTSLFLGVLKNVGNYPCTIRFADGVSGIMIETDHGQYNYLLRGSEV